MGCEKEGGPPAQGVPWGVRRRAACLGGVIARKDGIDAVADPQLIGGAAACTVPWKHSRGSAISTPSWRPVTRPPLKRRPRTARSMSLKGHSDRLAWGSHGRGSGEAPLPTLGLVYLGRRHLPRIAAEGISSRLHTQVH